MKTNKAAFAILISLLIIFAIDKETRLLFIGIIVIVAKAGCAWTPIGDVSTKMFWIDERKTFANMIAKLFNPSLVCALIP